MISFRPVLYLLPLFFAPGFVLAEKAEEGQNKKSEKIDFVRDVQPILEEQCVSCHKPGKAEGDLDLTTKVKAFESGKNAPSIVPGEPEDSSLYFLTVLDKDDVDLMPPANSGGPMPLEQTEILKKWILEGANWPDQITLTQKEKKGTDAPNPDDLELVKKIHAFIVQTSKEQKEGEMKAYTGKIALANDAEYSMTPIPSGSFKMGSPENEAGRTEDEGPQVEVQLDPFWMGTYEVTWDQYRSFMVNDIPRHKNGSKLTPNPEDKIHEMVSQPTTPYTEMSFGMGTTGGFPACSMTQHAANKFCQWLSAQTGHFYRLPTEAEWEYAARAGTTTAYSFGDDVAQLEEHAWYADNSLDDFGSPAYRKVGQKKPNAFGLYDMHGNLTEWVLDQFDPGYYKLLAEKGGVVKNPWNKATRPYPHSTRGGSFNHPAEDLRSAKRIPSSHDWKLDDPQLPQSVWYHTRGRWLGFRVVRPLTIPTPEEMYQYWNSGVEKDSMMNDLPKE